MKMKKYIYINIIRSYPLIFYSRDNKRMTRFQMKRMAEQNLTKNEKETTKTQNKNKKSFNYLIFLKLTENLSVLFQIINFL